MVRYLFCTIEYLTYKSPLVVNTSCVCHHPVRTNDGATAYVWSRTLKQHLKSKYTLSLKRNVINDCIYFKFSSNEWLQIYRMFYKRLQTRDAY